jgi:hypothetical protein
MKNDILPFAGILMKLENIMLSEVSQVQKAKGCMFSCVEYTWEKYKYKYKYKQYYEKHVLQQRGH